MPFRCLLLCCLLVLPLAHAQDAARPTLKKDYGAELPRIPPKEPEDALKTFVLRPGFRIDLVASEPLIRSPVAMDFDEDGRLYVVEYPEYNQYASKKDHGRGRVILLEDLDGDGRFDKSTVYVDQLDSPTAVACWDGGIFVGAVPHLLYCKDTDGDGRADIRRPVFSGFGRDPAGEGMLNSFRWGLDNRFHVSTSLAGGEVRAANKEEAKAVSIRGQGFLFDPRSAKFELTSGGGQHGMTLDDQGRTFVCDNSNPIHFLMYDGRYIARNPTVEAPAAAINISPGGKFTKIFRISAVEPWRALRTRLRKEGLVPGPDEGGQPAGFFTGATGITAYRGHAWPEEYRGNLFVGEVSGNLVYRARLEPNGAGFTALRADPDVEFLASSDNWFRPVQFANAPDGNLFVIDMYRELIEGAAFLPPAILQHLDPSSGCDRGRIYRIVRSDFKPARAPRLSQATTAELVQLLAHPNGWHRDTAARLLYQRQDRTAASALRQLATESRNNLAVLHALHALNGLSELRTADVVSALKHKDSTVREHALVLAEGLAGDEALLAEVARLAEDSDARVRYQLAFSVGAFAGETAQRTLVRLLKKESTDPWMRLALLSSVVRASGAVFNELVTDQGFRTGEAGRLLLSELAGQIGAADNTLEVAAFLDGIQKLPESDKTLAQQLVRGLVSRQSAVTRQYLARLSAGRAATLLGELLAAARRTAGEAKRGVPERVAALRMLALGEFSAVRESLTGCLQAKQPPLVQAAALEVLGRYDDAAVPQLVLDAWPSLSPGLRTTAAETLFSRSSWTTLFLDAMEQGRIQRGDVDPARIALLRSATDPTIKGRAEKLFASAGLKRRDDVVQAYRPALERKGDVTRGRAVFRKSCANCHQLEGVGTSVGADLSAIRDRGMEAVLLNILDPNREVKPQYLSYVLVTDAGRVLTGMIGAETANSVTIRRLDNTTETVQRNHIEELRSTGLSFMPEGLEQQVGLDAMADLLAYLSASR